MGWSVKKVQELQKQGKIKGFRIDRTPEQPKQLQQAQERPGIRYIKQQLEAAGIPFETEYRFTQARHFRFDIAVPALMLAIEYEGLVATGKKGGHQTKAGFTSNCTKYNLATIEGWRLLRYTSRNYKDFENDLKTILCN